MNRFVILLALSVGVATWRASGQDAQLRPTVFVVPGSASIISLDIPQANAPKGTLLLESAGERGSQRFQAPVVSAPAPDGTVSADLRRLVARLPADKGDRRFRVASGAETSAPVEASPFRFEPVNDGSLGLWEGERPVFVYHHGVQSRAGVPADRNRSTYMHPVHGLDGEVLTDDFPADHHHHRGLFWAWPHVRTEGGDFDLWTIRGVHQRFERWLAREVHGPTALLAVENGWVVNDRKILQERVWILTHSASDQARCLDLEFFWIPGPAAVTLAGAEGKSYGGLTMRYAPRSDAVITTPRGTGSADLEMTTLPWADYSGRWTGLTQPSGAALFIHPDHPDYPPTWLTRHYGALCVGWPGVEARTFAAGETIHCRYRVWVHRGMATQEALAAAYGAYLAEAKARWE